MVFTMKDIHIIKSLKTRETKAKMIKVFIIYVYLPLGVTVALLTPDNILDYSWARAYTDFMASWLPYVAEVGRWTKVPATQFIAAVMNLVAMLLSLSMIYCSKYYLEEKIERLSKMPKKKLIYLLLICIPFFICASYVILFFAPIANPPGQRDKTMIGSNLGMGVYGSMIIASGWIGIAAVVVIIISYCGLLRRRFIASRDS